MEQLKTKHEATQNKTAEGKTTFEGKYFCQQGSSKQLHAVKTQDECTKNSLGSSACMYLHIPRAT
eukprot:310820-Pelagomonas_calceolata.AAC.4